MYMPIVSPTRHVSSMRVGICVCVLLLTYCQQDTAIKAGAQKYWLNDEVVMSEPSGYSKLGIPAPLPLCAGPWASP